MFNNSNKAREELSSTAVDKVVKDNKRFMLKLLSEWAEFIEAFENMVHSRKQTRSFRKYRSTR